MNNQAMEQLVRASEQAQVRDITQIGTVQGDVVLALDNLPPEVLASLALKAQTLTMPLPRAADLFETIYKPTMVAAAVFRTASHGLAPYQIPYISERDGEKDVQTDLYNNLLDSGGALLVQGRAGLGKTREVAQLATRLSEDEGWTICVLRGDAANAQINTPVAFPDDLPDGQLLFVIDDLHRRVGNKGNQTPYPERLNAFLDFFEGKIDMYVIATARSEPKYQRELNFNSDHPLWSRFKVYELPEFTIEGLHTLLLTLSKQVGVAVDEAEATKMVFNSDRTPRTVVENVKAIQQEGQLTLEQWRPNYKQTWEQSFRRVYGKQRAAWIVYQSLHILQETGLPTRFAYVVQLGVDLSRQAENKFGSDEVATAVEALVNNGLIGLRDELLDAFGREQLADGLEAVSKALPELEAHWQQVIDAIVTQIGTQPEWSNDLKPFAYRLVIADKFKEAESISTIALGYDEHDAFLYLCRGTARFCLYKFALAEADLTETIAHGLDGADVYVLRGSARYGQANHAEAITDYTTAIDKGIDDANVYVLRGWARDRQANHAEAITDYTTAIDNGIDTVLIYFLRAKLRFKQALLNGKPDDFAQVEADLTAAIERGGLAQLFSSGYLDVAEVEATISQKWDQVVASDNVWSQDIDSATVVSWLQSNASLYSARGVARRFQGNYAGAKADFTAAIARGYNHASVYFLRGMLEASLRSFAAAEADYSIAIAGGYNHASVYDYRGHARLFQEKYAEAESDFTAAIERGQDDVQIFFSRGFVRHIQHKFVEAETDLTAAIDRGQDDALVYYMRGNTRFFRDLFAEAEADYAAAIARDENAILAYHERGLIHLQQRDYVEAETDFTAAIDRGHTRADVYYQRGCARLWQGGNYAEAEADYTQAIEQLEEFAAISRQDSVWVFYWRGRTRYSTGNYAEAAADFTTFIERGQSNAEVYFLRGKAEFYQGHYASAESDLNTAIERGLEDLEVHFWRGEARQYQNKYAQAEADYTIFITKSKENVNISAEHIAFAHHYRGLVRLWQHDYFAAEPDFTAALVHIKDDITLYQNRALTNIYLDRLDQARQDCEMAEQLDHNDLRTDSIWGTLYLALRQYDEAITYYRTAIRKNPSGNYGYFDLGLAWLLSGQLEQAKTSIDKFIETASANDFAYALHDLDYWTEKQADRVTSNQSQSTITIIRQMLTAKLAETSNLDSQLSEPKIS